ncbi:MFS transporter [Aquincola sp. S2]|uniref:MFS transporter n=1 Tax=Pseudaquabacterium terrae TaxID=2732868 RepID=A0ABX2ENF9_9BURK|nr:MFS transporter [Aquabacterium terrae]NRF70102.1 MFS transporter [Aquabacterium terrae]
MSRGSPWPAILGYYLIGVLGAAQMGKLSALAPQIAAELGLSLTTAAAAVSLLEVGGATLGAVAGLLAQRIGLKRTLLGGLACLALGGGGAGFAQGAVSLLAWRLVEAIGFLGVIVTAPVLIASVAGPVIGVALALWSSFVPVGLALGAWLWAALAAQFGWRPALMVAGGLALLALGACAFAQARGPVPVAHAAAHDRSAGTGAAGLPNGGGAADLRNGGGAAVWCLAASFGCCTLAEVGLLALLPSFLVGQAGAAQTVAASWTGVASIAAVAGSLVAALLLRRGVDPRGPVVASMALPALLMFGVFVEAPLLLRSALLATLLNAIYGVYFSLAFAALPAAAGGAAGMVRANGLLAQFGAGGALIGPPLMAAGVERWGWPAAAWCSAVLTLVGVPLALRGLRPQPAPGRSQAG